jgi:hypothetical protein
MTSLDRIYMNMTDAVCLCFRKKHKSLGLIYVSYWFVNQERANVYIKGTSGRKDLDWDYDTDENGKKVLGLYRGWPQEKALEDFKQTCPTQPNPSQEHNHGPKTRNKSLSRLR